LQQTDVSWFTFVALNVDLGGQDVASIRPSLDLLGASGPRPSMSRGG
jgi:hypothetical protein